MVRQKTTHELFPGMTQTTAESKRVIWTVHSIMVWTWSWVELMHTWFKELSRSEKPLYPDASSHLLKEMFLYLIIFYMFSHVPIWNGSCSILDRNCPLIRYAAHITHPDHGGPKEVKWTKCWTLHVVMKTLKSLQSLFLGNSFKLMDLRWNLAGNLDFAHGWVCLNHLPEVWILLVWSFHQKPTCLLPGLTCWAVNDQLC